MPLLHMEFVRAGHATAPTRKKRSCLPPLIRLPFGQPPSPRGRHPSDGSVHFYVVQPYPLRATQAWPTSPCTPGGSASPKASPEFVRIGACRRPYTQKRSCLPPLIRLPFGQPPSPRGRHPSDGSVHFYIVQPYPLYIDQRLLRKISGKGKNSG